MNEPPLGRLERVDGLRKTWATEDRDFTPWLAHPENLAVLAETLGLELETEAREKPVGPFRADILCKEIGSGSDAWVLIENQLERTDHAHLGQLMTYAAGLDAVTVIWIAASFTDEHRAALDWLNGITDERFRFFGLEVELWRIGESPPAPKFNIVSKPNDWSRSIARAAAGAELSETRIRQKEYWGALLKVLDDEKGLVSGNREPKPNYWIDFPVGRKRFSLNASMVLTKNRIQTELYIAGNDAKAFFGLLKRQKDEIERELGYSLGWKELPKKRDCRIMSYCDHVDPMDEADWPRQHKWLAEHLNAMHRVFAPRVKDLDPDDWQGDDQTPSA